MGEGGEQTLGFSLSAIIGCPLFSRIMRQRTKPTFLHLRADEVTTGKGAKGCGLV